MRIIIAVGLPGSGGQPPMEELLWWAPRGEVIRHHLDPSHLSFICHHLSGSHLTATTCHLWIYHIYLPPPWAVTFIIYLIIYLFTACHLWMLHLFATIKKDPGSHISFNNITFMRHHPDESHLSGFICHYLDVAHLNTKRISKLLRGRMERTTSVCPNLSLKYISAGSNPLTIFSIS